MICDEDEEFIENSLNTDGYSPSSIIISYHKDSILHPLNAVKEDIEAEAAEEEISGNYHSLDYLSLGGHSSLSSSIVSSTSVDDCQEPFFGCKSSYTSAMNSKAQCEDSTPLPCRLLNGKNATGSKSPALSKTPLGRGSPKPNNSEVNLSHLHFQSKDSSPRVNHAKGTPKCQAHLHGNFRNSDEKKTPIWHNPAKSDRILSTDKENSILCKRECKDKKDGESTKNDTKYNSLPRTKEKKSDKDIVAETYGTLSRNRFKRTTKDTNSSKTQLGSRDIPHEAKNTLDKYATLPRRKARELSSKWQAQRPALQRSKSTSKTDTQPAKSSPLLTTSLTSSISSRIMNSLSKTSTGKVQEKSKENCISRVLPKRQSSLREKGNRIISPSKHSKSSSKRSVLVQVSIPQDDREEDLQNKLLKLSEEYDLLQRRLSASESNAQEVEELRMEANELRKTVEMEKQEKEELQEELDRTSTRVKNMLTSMEDVEKEFNNRGDSLIELQSQVQNSTDISVKLQERLNQSEDLAVKLRKDLDKSLAAQKILLQQVHDLEMEGREMAEFMAEEKNALSECLKEAEAEVGRVRKDCEELSTRLQQKDEEARHMVRLAEERRKEYLSLQSEMCSMQSNTQDLMVCQGAEVSGASVALTNLITRLQTLTGKLIQDYTISENDIENVVTPADSESSLSSSTNGTPEHQRSPIRINNRTSTPRKPVSFMQSFLNAMRIAQSTSKVLAHSLKSSKEPLSTQIQSSSSEGRNSPDGSENRSFLELAGDVNGHTQSASLSLLDQVTEVDFLLTRFLKVCCVLKNDADIILSELEDENERLCNQLQLQHQMIDQHYSKFESLSTFETNARKELRIISKDLEMANETLLKVCNDNPENKEIIKLGEDIQRMSCVVQHLESLHADKERTLHSALQKFAHSHTHDLGAMLIPDAVQGYDRGPNASYRMQQHRTAKPNPKDHRVLLNRTSPKAPHIKNMKDDFTNCNNSSFSENAFDDHSTSVNEVDLIINHVLKTLESVPDVVSSCNILKNLYLNLTTQDPLERTKVASPHKENSPQEITTFSNELETNEKEIVANIAYDCNANPDPSNSNDPLENRDSNSSSNGETNPLLPPVLGNETSL